MVSGRYSRYSSRTAWTCARTTGFHAARHRGAAMKPRGRCPVACCRFRGLLLSLSSLVSLQLFKLVDRIHLPRHLLQVVDCHVVLEKFAGLSMIRTAGPSSMNPKNDTGRANGTFIFSLPPRRALSGLSKDRRQNAAVPRNVSQCE